MRRTRIRFSGGRRLGRKKRILVIGAAALVLLAAVVIFFLLRNRKPAAAETAKGALPVVSFELENGREVNRLHGYVSKRDTALLRGPIVSNEGTHTLKAIIQTSGLKKVSYKITDPSGKEELETGTLSMEETKTGRYEGEFLFGDTFGDRSEVVMQLTVSRKNEDDVFYYTRLTRKPALNTERCIDFAFDFHGMTMDESRKDDIAPYLEGDTSASSPMQTVTLGSTIEQVMWQGMMLSDTGTPSCTIRETTENYTCLILTYYTNYSSDNGTGRAKVREFYRIRCASNGLKLLNFERTMEEVFDPAQAVTDKGLQFGLTDPNIEYMTNEDGTKTAFVQNEVLWQYDADANTFVRIWPTTGDAEPPLSDPAEQILPISVGKDGNMAFCVIGYCAAGENIGRVGVQIGNYDAENGMSQINLFLPLAEGEEIAMQDFSGRFYYSAKQDAVYALLNQTLYRIDCASGKETVLADKLSASDCAFDGTNGLCAYRKDSLHVLNLEDGKERVDEDADGEVQIPIGFLGSDFLCGIASPDDAGTDSKGQPLQPLRSVEIRDNHGAVIKEWSKEGALILSTEVEPTLVTLHCGIGSEKVYRETSTDYITSNEEIEEMPVAVETVRVDGLGSVVRMVFNKTLSADTPTINTAKESGERKTVSLDLSKKKGLTAEASSRWYAYGYGRLIGSYRTAGEAVLAADGQAGVVVSGTGNTVWERGNRDLTHTIEGDAAAKIPAGTMDLTGVTAEELCYVLYTDRTVSARVDDGRTVILYAYDRSRLFYRDPASGETGSFSYQEADDTFERNGRVLLADE